MKFVYSLISSSADFYAEQAFLSMISLRKHNPDAHIVLVTDNETGKNLKELRCHLIEPVAEVIEVDIPQELNQKCRSRYLKSSLRKIIEGDFLYIDSDTVIRGNLDLLENFDCDIAASYDCNGRGEGSDYMKEKFQIIGETVLDDYVFFNSGVMLIRDTPLSHKFFNDWNSIWRDYYKTYSIEIDQVSFLKANLKNGNVIKELPGEYNCQLSFHNSIDYLLKSKILHYLADCAYYARFPFEEQNLLLNVRNNGIIKDTEEILEKPIEKFLKYNTMIGKKEMDLYSTPLVILAKKISSNFPWINTFIISCINFCRKNKKQD